VRCAALLLLSLAGCVQLTTRASITVGAGGHGEIVFDVAEGADVRVTNTGPVEVLIRLDAAPPVPMAPGATHTFAASPRVRIGVHNPTPREAGLLVVSSPR
jgi:hypothetical protein